MGNMEGSVKTKARLAVGSVVVYSKEINYKGFDTSPTFQQRLTVKGIYKTHVKLEETPNINYDLSDFFEHFVEIGM